MVAKQARTKVLYTRVKPKNMAWIKMSMKKLGYTSMTDYIDTHFDLLRNKKAVNDRHAK